jgi:hypothetical protein
MRIVVAFSVLALVLVGSSARGQYYYPSGSCYGSQQSAPYMAWSYQGATPLGFPAYRQPAFVPQQTYQGFFIPQYGGLPGPFDRGEYLQRSPYPGGIPPSPAYDPRFGSGYGYTPG